QLAIHQTKSIMAAPAGSASSNGVVIAFEPIRQTVSIGDGYLSEESFVMKARPARVQVVVEEETLSNYPLQPPRGFEYTPSANRFLELTQAVNSPMLSELFNSVAGTS